MTARRHWHKPRRLVDWLFRSRITGQITIAQFPNAPLWIFFGTVALRRFLSTGTASRTVVNWTSAVALTWWAFDELLRGVNPWRRALGFTGCVFALTSLRSLVNGI
jgi:hypothetical protein